MTVEPAAPGPLPDALAGFLAAFPDPTWSTTPDGVLTAWNPAAARVFGLPAGQALGRPAVEVVGAGVRLCSPGDDDAVASSPFALLRPGGPAVRGVLTTWGEGGPGPLRRRHSSLRVTVADAGPQGRRPLEELLEQVSDAVLTVDADGTVLSLNGAAARMWGVDVAAAVGSPLREVTGWDGADDCLAQVRASHAEGRSWRGVEVQVTTRTGRALLVDTSATVLLDVAGTYCGSVLVGRDITPVRELEQSLRAATRALRDRASQLAHATHRDSLTGVAARSLLQERLAAALTASVQDEGPVSLLAADLDGFRAVNDSYGLATGDAVLIAFADHLRVQLPPAATAGRMGADEFAVVLPGVGPQEAAAIAARVAAWSPPSPLPSRGRHGGDVGVTVVVVQATSLERRSPFDTGVRSVLVRVEDELARAKAARRPPEVAAWTARARVP